MFGDVPCAVTVKMCRNHFILCLFQSAGGGGMSSNVTPMSRPDKERMGGGYAGANVMANNGLSANQNQVNRNDKS